MLPNPHNRRGLDLSKVESTGDVLEFDTNMVAPYNGYKVGGHNISERGLRRVNPPSPTPRSLISLQPRKTSFSMYYNSVISRLPCPAICSAVLFFGLVKSVSDYYVDMSAAAEGKLAGLRTPMLAVSAMDDPIMTAGGLPIDEMEKTKDLYILLTRYVVNIDSKAAC